MDPRRPAPTRSRRWAAVAASVLIAVVPGCFGSDDGSGPTVTRREAGDGSPSFRVIAVGQSLFGTREEPGADELVESADRGVTWEPLELPDAPTDVKLSTQLLSFDHGAVFTGRAFDPIQRSGDGPAWVWTFLNGRWHATRLAEDVSSFLPARVEAVGDVLIAGITTFPPLRFDLFRSTDRGVTWQPTAVPDLGVSPAPDGDPDQGETAYLLESWAFGGRLYVQVMFMGSGQVVREDGPLLLVSDDGGASWQEEPYVSWCPPVGSWQGGLVTRRSEVSRDGGRTWTPSTIRPSATGDLTFDAVVVAGGSWLATASSGGSDSYYGHLLRSADGVRWERLLAPDPCEELGGSRPNSTFSDPVRLGGRWYVAYSCQSLDEPQRAELYSADDDLQFETVDGTLREQWYYGQPVVVDGRLLVSEHGREGRVVAMTELRP